MKRQSVLFCLCPFVLFLTIPPAVQGDLWVVDYRYGPPSPGYDTADSPLLDCWFEVQPENQGLEDVFNVEASLSSAPGYITIVDDTVFIGDVPSASSAWSLDTFEIRVDTGLHPLPSSPEPLGLESCKLNMMTQLASIM